MIRRCALPLLPSPPGRCENGRTIRPLLGRAFARSRLRSSNAPAKGYAASDVDCRPPAIARRRLPTAPHGDGPYAGDNRPFPRGVYASGGVTALLTLPPWRAYESHSCALA